MLFLLRVINYSDRLNYKITVYFITYKKSLIFEIEHLEKLGVDFKNRMHSDVTEVRG